MGLAFYDKSLLADVKTSDVLKSVLTENPGLQQRVKRWKDHKDTIDEISKGAGPEKTHDGGGLEQQILGDALLRTYASGIAGVEERLEHIEEHLASEERGQPFLKKDQRPPVGKSVLENLAEEVRRLREAIEGQRGEGGHGAHEA